MSIRKIRPTSAVRLRTRVAALVAVPALAAGGLLAAGNAVAYAAPNCGIGTIVGNINTVAAQADDLNQALSNIDFNSSSSQVSAAGNSLTAQLSTLNSELSDDANDLSQCGSLSTADAKTAAKAFSDAAGVIGALLSTTTEKHSIFAQFGFTTQIAARLRNFEAAFDTYSFSLTDAASSQAGSISSNQNQVDASLENAIATYQQICIPSPLYPTVKPICISL